MIFTVTSYTEEGKDRRVFGYFFDVQRAIEAINKDEGSLSEAYYDYVVLEKVLPGIHGEGSALQWYKWDDKKQGWNPAYAPKWAEGIVNFSIG